MTRFSSGWASACLVAIAATIGGCHRPSARQEPGSPAEATDVAIVDVTVVPMDRDGVLPHHTVVVRGDRIVAVAPTSAIEIPASARRIEGRGAYLMPGLADMHVHTFAPNELTMFVAAGVTLVRNMFGMPLHLQLRREVATGKLLGPTIVTAGPIIDGDPPIWPGSAVVKTPADAEEVVADQKEAGYDFLKVYSRLSAEAYDAVASAAARHGLSFVGHVPLSIPLERALASGQRSIEHLDGYLAAMASDSESFPMGTLLIRRMAILSGRLDEAKLSAVVEATIKSRTWNCPTLVVWDRFGRMNDPAALAVETRWVKYLPADYLASWNPKSDFRLKDVTPEDYANFRGVNETLGRLLRAIQEKGGKILVGTDMGNPYVVPGASLHDEIELMVQAGLPRPKVLRAATAGAAEFFEQVGSFGVVAPGARADLILTARNPLEEPIAIPPEGVMLRGVWHDRGDLQASLDALVGR